MNNVPISSDFGDAFHASYMDTEWGGKKRIDFSFASRHVLQFTFLYFAMAIKIMTKIFMFIEQNEKKFCTGIMMDNAYSD